VLHFVAARGSLGVRHRVSQRPASAQATFFHQAGARVSVATVDDAWLFVNGRLAVDLGGLGPKTGGVALDALSLVPGQQYKLALFTARRYDFRVWSDSIHAGKSIFRSWPNADTSAFYPHTGPSRASAVQQAPPAIPW